MRVYSVIPLDGSLTVLTGLNGTGKSLIRSQLNHRVKAEFGHVVHASMGALSSMTHDVKWLATSFRTLRAIERTMEQAAGNYYAIDEPELRLGFKKASSSIISNISKKWKTGDKMSHQNFTLKCGACKASLKAPKDGVEVVEVMGMKLGRLLLPLECEHCENTTMFPVGSLLEIEKSPNVTFDMRQQRVENQKFYNV